MTRVEDVAFKKNFSDILQKPYIPAGQRLKEISTNAYNPLPTDSCHAQICLSTTGFLDKLGTESSICPGLQSEAHLPSISTRICTPMCV
jgi:hypothetical protein